MLRKKPRIWPFGKLHFLGKSATWHQYGQVKQFKDSQISRTARLQSGKGSWYMLILTFKLWEAVLMHNKNMQPDAYLCFGRGFAIYVPRKTQQISQDPARLPCKVVPNIVFKLKSFATTQHYHVSMLHLTTSLAIFLSKRIWVEMFSAASPQQNPRKCGNKNTWTLQLSILRYVQLIHATAISSITIACKKWTSLWNFHPFPQRVV